MRNPIFLTAVFTVFSLLGFSQNNWQDMMHDRNVNFYDIQADFNLYYDSVMVGETSIPKGKGIKQFKRWEYYWQNRVDQFGNFPPQGHTLREAQDYRDDNAGRSYETGTGSWEIVGPTPTPTNGTGQPNGSGRINCIAFHPTDANTIYVGAPSGGFWKSTDNGSTWTEYSDGLVRLGVSSIIVHPTNPNTIYIATGDRDGGDAPGYGVWRSTNGGASWSSRNNGMGNRTVYEILMHPTNSNILIASTSGGRIYRSTDAGANWNYVSVGTNCKDIAFHPTDPNIVYGAGGSFVRSTNNGVSFGAITSGIPAASRLAIGVSVDEPTWVYLLCGDGNGLVELVRSTDSGQNFSSRTTTPNILGWDWDGSDVGSQAWYDLVMAVNPNDADEIYTGGINIWKSTDGGSNMTLTAHWVGSGGADDVHADHHAMEFSPHNNNLYNGNDGGIYFTANSGTDWTDISSGLAIAQMYKMGISQTVENLAINGYQDNGTAVSEGTAFRTEIGGDGMECIVDPTDENYMYGSLYYGAIRRSTNNGFNFGNIVGGISEDGGWVTPFKLDPGNASRMYAGFDNVWRTDNVKAGTVAWTSLSNFGGTNNCVDLAVAPSDNNVVYVSRSTGQFYRTSNAQAGSPTWTDLSGNLPSSSTPKDIEIDPLDEDHLFIAVSLDIYESTDGGVNWSNFSGTLPNVSLNTIVIDQNSPVGGMYVGMDVGVYYRDNNMSDWEQYYTGLPNIEVTELEIYYNTTDCRSSIYAATYAQGLWKSDLKDPGTVAPIACFESDVQVGCTATPIVFTDLSSYTPTSWTWSFSPNTVTFVNSTTANSENPEVTFNATGLYTVTLTATNSNGSDSEVKTDYISIINSVLTAPTLSSPANAATGVAIPTSFSWTAVSGSTITYDLDIATDAAFTNIIDAQTGLTSNAYSTGALSSNTTYYWRVKAFENCAESPFTSTFSFTTGNCTSAASTDVPISISDVGTPTVTSDLVVSAAGTITSITVLSLDVSHTWINDLEITLTSPGGTTLSLIDRICAGENDINVILDDGAVTPITAAPCPPTGGNSYQPDASLSGFVGETAAGTWVLTITDHVNQDGGDLNGWSLGICTSVPTCTDAGTPTLSLSADPVCPGGSSTLTVTGSLNDATAWEVYTATGGGGTNLGSTTSTISLTSVGATTFYVRGEGGCTNPGPEATIVLNGVDNTPPSISCPSNTSENANGLCQVSLPDYTGAATATDNCPGTPTVTQSPAASTIITGSGTTQTVTLTATDGSSNTANCTFDVTVTDNTPPSITCPSNTTEDANASCQVSLPDYTGAATVADNCSGSPAVTQSPAATTLISGVGTVQTVTLTVTDGSSNTANCTFDVTITDNTDPVVTCPSITEINPSTTCGMPDLTGAASVSDNCDASPTIISQSPAAATNISSLVGTNQTLTITAVDASGNTGNCAVVLPVVDNTAPTITCPSNTNENANGACEVALPNYATSAVISDDCDGAPIVLQSPGIGSLITGVGTVQTVTLTVSDASSNTANCTFDVTIVDTSDPSITCPGTVSVTANPSTCTASPSLGTPSTGDNCSVATTVNDAPTNFNAGNTIVTWTVTDGSGNTNTCTQQVSVSGNTPAQPGAITGSAVVCSGDNETYSITAVAGATGYTWNLPSGWTGSSTTNSITVVTGSNAGNISVTANNACGSSTAQTLAVSHSTTPSQPGIISGNSTACPGSTEIYSIAAVAGANSYQWSLPSGWVGTSTSTSISATVGSNSGTISVSAVGSCGNSIPQTLSVNPVSPPAQPSPISGLSPACPNSSQTYSVPAVAGAVSYTWTLPAGWTGTSTTNSVTVVTTTTGGSISVNAVDACGQNGVAQTLAISIITVDDGIPCTLDACNPANGSVTHTPNDALCDDGLWCNGQETCDVLLGCMAGTAPNLDDGNGCTDDSCDETLDQVVHTFNTAPCDDGNPLTTNDQCLNGVCVGTPIGNVWTGSINSTWGIAGNWSMFVPSSSDDAIIPTVPIGGVFPVIPSGFIAVVNNIDIQSGATVTAQAGGTLNVFGTLTNDGTVNVNDSGSLLQQTGSTIVGAGTYNIQRQGSSGQKFNFWSSPITNKTNVPGTSYRYNSNSGTQTDADDTPSDPGWVAYNGLMVPGTGYSGMGAGLTTFSGIVNNGPINKALDYYAFDNTYSQTTPGTPFNLAGNPYPSAISATALVNANPDIDGTLYFWDDDNSAGSDYHRSDFAYWNGTGGLGTGAGSVGAPNGFISTAQGFYVRAINSGAVLNYTNAQRVPASNSQFFRMAGADSRLWFSIEKDSSFNQVLIGMLEDATTEEDRLYDAVKMHTANSVSLAAMANDREHAIMAFPPPTNVHTVPLLVTVNEAGDYTFRANTMENFEGYQVFFNDQLNNSDILLQEETSIDRYLNAGEYENRFYLNFVQSTITGLGESEVVSLNAYPVDDMLHIYLSGTSSVNGSVELLDMSGRSVLSIADQYFADNGTIIPLNDLSNGVYIVRVTTQNETLSKRVLLK